MIVDFIAGLYPTADFAFCQTTVADTYTHSILFLFNRLELFRSSFFWKDNPAVVPSDEPGLAASPCVF